MFLDIESLHSWWLPFQPNLYCISIKRPTSIKRPKSRGWPLNRGPTVHDTCMLTYQKFKEPAHPQRPRISYSCPQNIYVRLGPSVPRISYCIGIHYCNCWGGVNPCKCETFQNNDLLDFLNMLNLWSRAGQIVCITLSIQKSLWIVSHDNKYYFSCIFWGGVNPKHSKIIMIDMISKTHLIFGIRQDRVD